jgi:Ca2+-binding RTX toxin-like protein
VIADGAAPGRAQAQLLDNSGELALVTRTSGAPASIFDPAADLVLRHVAADGTVRTVKGDLIHTADPTPGDPTANALNSDGAGRVVSLQDPVSGQLLIGFEDGGDFDFNDVVIAVENAPVGLNPIIGTDGVDYLVGTAGPDRIAGLKGADRLAGGAGDDVLEGNRGTDLLYGDDPVPVGVETLTAAAGGQGLALSLSAPASAGGELIDLAGLIAPAAYLGATFNLALVVDVSGSMAADLAGAAAVGDRNGDGLADTRLDAMIAGLEELAQGLVDSGRAGAVEIGLIPFATDATLAARFNAGADSDLDGVLDLIEQARALEFGGGTDYGRAFEVALDFFQGQPPATNLLYFVSDGQGFGDFAGDLAALTDPAGLATTIATFGIGGNVSPAQLAQIDSGGAPTLVATSEQLLSSLAAAPLSATEIARVDVLLDGVAVATLGPDDLRPTPLGLAFETTIAGLSTATGAHNAIEVVVTSSADPGAPLSVSHDIVGAGSGDDRLIGGRGPDVLFGGGGADAFVYKALDEGTDLIVDFDARAGDVLDLAALLDTLAPAALDELVSLGVFDDDGDGRADDFALAVDADAAGPGTAVTLAVLIDPVGLTSGASAQELADAGTLVV